MLLSGLGCSNPLAMNANSPDNIPCVFGDATPPPPTQVVVTRPFGNTSGETADVPMDSLETWLYDKVVTPAAGSPTGQYVDPSLMQTMLQQAAQQYCAGTSFGVTSGPCAGADLGSTVANLTQTYAAQVAAKGGTPSTNLNNAPSYTFTSFAPGYNSGGPGFILMPDGSKVPNTPGALGVAQQAYNVSIGLPANYQNVDGSGGGQPVSTPASRYSAAPVSNPGQSGALFNSIAPAVGAQQGSGVTSINGTPVNGSGVAAASWLTDPAQELMSGVPNWALAAAAAVVGLMLLKK